MKLFYYKAAQGNFGDDLNGWLWQALLPGQWNEQSDILFSGIGTILGNSMPPARHIIVFTSGIGYSPRPADFDSPRWNVMALRGPLTALALEQPESAAVADGALLLSTLPEFAPLPEARRHGVVFVPHYEALLDGGWAEAAYRAGVELLDPRGDSREVIARLRSARLVLADSMHAAIIADTLRVPWIPLMSSSRINSFKWLDWSLSLGVPYEPVALPAPTVLGAYANAVQPFYGQGFSVRPPTREAAVAHFRRMMALQSRRWWRHARPRLKHLLHKLPDQAMRLSIVQRQVQRLDQRRVDRTAVMLRAQASRTGYLSDNAILGARIDELRDRLSRTAALAQTMRPG
ncbi:succinoglycan biosynthesis ketolase [Sphingomonas oleivorans]|uniref:Succinoglycan biosynthesis ketolase n=1 Tax=Sphingomonas oleivorans TaxID=1735121 RepID=A0A2T5FYX5_9SPHN|nr:polysaccharide pyruvyl transferase family protein [Sphingomonas oleivorans]PTQ11789.1 succinoglycan biosynthesis ketolase [Sphingomonas oleivorans]